MNLVGYFEVSANLPIDNKWGRALEPVKRNYKLVATDIINLRKCSGQTLVGSNAEISKNL
jgi:serine kinase of HPr protein (carbohydrate metabolism regulator)